LPTHRHLSRLGSFQNSLFELKKILPSSTVHV
jgi:hypothetical protein